MFEHDKLSCKTNTIVITNHAGYCHPGGRKITSKAETALPYFLEPEVLHAVNSPQPIRTTETHKCGVTATLRETCPGVMLLHAKLRVQFFEPMDALPMEAIHNQMF